MSRGKYTYGFADVFRERNNANLIIGNFCSISDGFRVFLGGNHNIDWVTTYPFGHTHTDVFNMFDGTGHPSSKGDVVIGNDVWIGYNVTVLSGVKIGDGAVIGTNSLVIKDVEPYSVVAGNPAKHIKYRFSPEQIEKLLQIQWWNWEDEKINRFTPLLCNKDIDHFIEAALKEQS